MFQGLSHNNRYRIEKIINVIFTCILVPNVENSLRSMGNCIENSHKDYSIPGLQVEHSREIPAIPAKLPAE